MLKVVTPDKRQPPAPDFVPVIREWMKRKFAAPTQAQSLAWPAIAEGRSTLVFSPTGSGKTLAAFLWAINELIELGEQGKLPTRPYIIYVSPLRALANDIEKNLLSPLAELREIAAERKTPFPDIQVAVRTGDTPPRDRQRMLRQPPQIIITTPESFFLLLTSRFREHLTKVRYVIVDEIHYLCADKRGAHLALTLERLEELIAGGDQSPSDHAGTSGEMLARASQRPRQTFVRIGLSATQSPVEEVARFLVGYDDRGRERDCTIVDIGVHRNLEVRVCSPVPNLVEAKPEEVWNAIYEQLLALIRQHRTTLIFCNSKHWTERVAAKLNMLAEEEGIRIGAHHGSMARSFRLEMEHELKTGGLRAIVATSSLELGIDIGHLDLVCQVESPKNVASGLQRVGRAGHLLGLTSKGQLFCTSRDDLVEMAVLARAMRAGELEPVRIPNQCLDVLAQQIAAMVAVNPLPRQRVLDICRRAYNFRTVTDEEFERVIEQLAGQYQSRELFQMSARLNYNRTQRSVSAARNTAKVAQQNVGTIPEHAEYAVHAEEYDKKIGDLDEEFVQRMRPGQIFVLGTKTWEFSRIERNRVYVRDGRGRSPTVPYWEGPAVSRTFQLGEQVARFREEMFQRLFTDPGGLRQWLMTEYCCDEWAADQLVEYFLEQAHSLDSWPTRENLVVEVSRNPLGHRQMLVHSPYGGPVNEAWAEALVQAARDELDLEMQATTSDNAFVLHLPPGAAHQPEQLLSLVRADNVTDKIEKYVRESAMFAIHFRQAAVRSLAVLRMRQGRRVPVWQQEAAARAVEREVGTLPEFPVVAETMRECMEDYLDVTGLKQILREIARGNLQLIRADVDVPSPFGHELLLGGQFGPMSPTARRERRTELLALHREVLKQVLDEDAIRALLDPEVVGEFEQRRQGRHATTRARDAEEFLRTIRRCGEVSENPASELFVGHRASGAWQDWLAALWADRRIVPVLIPHAATDPVRWIAAEDFYLYARAFGRQAKESHAERALLNAVRGAGQATTEELQEVVGKTNGNIAQRLRMRYELVHCGQRGGTEVWAIPNQWLPVPAPGRLSRLRARREVLYRVLRGFGPTSVQDLAGRYGMTSKTVLSALRDLFDTGELQQGDFVKGRAAPQVSARANLEELHRLVLARMRREIEPVQTDRYLDFLMKWQCLSPKHNLEGPEALSTIVEQQAGFRAYPLIWERDILGTRIKGIAPNAVADAVRKGEVLYGQFAAGDRPPRPLLSALTFLPANRASDLIEMPSTEGLSRDEEGVLRAIRQEGELSLKAVTERASLSGEVVENILWRLLRCGLIINTDYEAIARCRWTHPPRWERDLFGGDEKPGEEEEPTENVGKSDPGGAGDLRRAGLRAGSGKWRPVETFADQTADDAAVGRRCRARVLALMDRYGVAAREVLLAKSGLSTADVSRGLRELFLRGQLLRGFFVKGLSGDQFALPAALDRLRNERIARSEPPIMLNSLDPAALHLSVIKVADGINRALASRYLVLRQGELACIVDCQAGEGRFFRVRDLRFFYSDGLSERRQAALHNHVALALVEYAARWGKYEEIRISGIDGIPVKSESAAVLGFVAAGYVRRHGQLRYRLRKRVGAQAAKETMQRVVKPEEAKPEHLHPTSKPVIDFFNYIMAEYQPPEDRDMLVIFQCSVSRPYSKSPSHSSMRKAIRLATGKDPKDEDCRCHVVVLSSVIGPVPYDMENVYPATESGGGVKHMRPEQYRIALPVLAERMAAYLRKWHERYKVITTFTHSRYGDVMQAAKKMAGIDFRVLPDLKGTRLKGGNQYWTKYWIQVFFELLGGMTEEERQQALARLQKEKVEIDDSGA